jgi:hypothetical protein
MFDNDMNRLFASFFAITAPAEKAFLINVSLAVSVFTPHPPTPAPRISTQPLRNTTQPQGIFAA